jgi:acyl carrier protein
MSPTELVVRDVYLNVLELSTVDPEQDLFALGGDSVHAVRIALELERRFEFEVPVNRFEEDSSVRSIAAWIDLRAPK